MAVPRKKVTRSKRNMRRSHHALRRAYPAECPHCGEDRLPHHVCLSCGRYRERSVIAESELPE